MLLCTVQSTLYSAWLKHTTVGQVWLYTIGGLDWWTGLVDWTTGLIDFHLKRTFGGSIMRCNGGK